MSFRLVATDLDGTLLDGAARITPRARDAIRAVRDAGVHVVPVTARGPWSAERLASDAGMDGPGVLVSGAVLWDLGRRVKLHDEVLGVERGRRAVTAMRAAAPGVRFAAAREGAFDTEPGYRMGITPPEGSITADALELVERPVWKLAMQHDEHGPDALQSIACEAVPDACVACSGGSWIDISAPGARKAAMLQRLCLDVGIASHEVVAFGDLPIDQEMLDWAGLGVAPANAHPDVRAAADEVAGSNEADGVAIVLERLLAERAFG